MIFKVVNLKMIPRKCKLFQTEVSERKIATKKEKRDSTKRVNFPNITRNAEFYRTLILLHKVYLQGCQ